MQSPRAMTALALAVMTCSICVGDMSPAPKQPAPKTGWHSSFSEAQAEAKALGKPLLVHFYADWCGPCQQMERTVLNQPGVLRCLGTDIVGVKINADHHPDLKSRFGVSGFPSDVVVSPDGTVSARYVGISSQSSFIARLQREGAKFPGQPETELAEKSKEKPKAERAAEKPATEPLGLEGYSPVALTTGKLWKKGQPQWSARYQGIVYRFADEQELDLFIESPAKYVPRLLGCDPVILAESGRAVQGKSVHGVFFRKSVYLMATEANRTEFLKKPAYYADKRFAVEVDEIEQYVSR